MMELSTNHLATITMANIFDPNVVAAESEMSSNYIPELVAVSSSLRIGNDSVLTSSDFTEESTTVSSSQDCLPSTTVSTTTSTGGNALVEYEPQYKDQSRHVTHARGTVSISNSTGGNALVEYEPQYKDQSRHVPHARGTAVLEPKVPQVAKPSKQSEQPQCFTSKRIETVMKHDESKMRFNKSYDLADDDDENDVGMLECNNNDEPNIWFDVPTDDVDNLIVVTNDSNNCSAHDDTGMNASRFAAVQAESIIPMAEAFVIATDDRESRQSLEEYPVVQLDEGTSSTASPFLSGTASTATNTSHESLSGRNEGSQTSGDRNIDENFDTKLKTLATEAVKGERKFWMRIILAAVLLNTVLVAGVVVAGFCLSGACEQSQNSKSDNLPNEPYSNPTMAPTLAPSASSTVSISTGNLTLTTGSEKFANDSSHDDLVDTSNAFDDWNSTSARGNHTLGGTAALYPGSLNSTMPPSCYDCDVPLHPSFNRPLSPGNDSTPVFSGATSAPQSEYDSSQPPVIGSATTTPESTESTESTSSNSKSIVWSLIGVAVGFEIMIILCLWLYYRSWKRKRDLLKRSQADKNVSEKHLDL